MIPYGGFWWRVLAYFIDGIVLAIANGMIEGIFGIGMGPFTMLGAERDVFASVAFMGMTGGLLLVNLLYFAVMESSRLQASVGKLAVGLIVTDIHGERIGFGRALGRYLAKILSAAILCIGFIMVAFTERKQGLHDLIAGTLVYRTRDPKAVVNDERIFA